MYSRPQNVENPSKKRKKERKKEIPVFSGKA